MLNEQIINYLSKRSKSVTLIEKYKTIYGLANKENQFNIESIDEIIYHNLTNKSEEINLNSILSDKIEFITKFKDKNFNLGVVTLDEFICICQLLINYNKECINLIKHINDISEVKV